MSPRTTLNPTRDAMLDQAIKETRDAELPLTLDNISLRLPIDFDVLQSEVDLFLAPSIEPAAVADQRETRAPPKPRPPSPQEIEAASNRVVAANNTLAQARADLIVRQRAEKEANDKLARAIV